MPDLPEGPARDILDLLVLHAAGDLGAADAALDKILDGGDQDLMAMCTGLIAMLAAEMAPGFDPRDRGDGGYTMEIVGPDEQVIDASKVLAAGVPEATQSVNIGRMVAAYLNGDLHALFALFDAGFDAGQVGWVHELIRIGSQIVVGKVRARIDGHLYRACPVCSCPQFGRPIPAGGFTLEVTLFAKLYTPHESWCPQREETRDG